MRGTVPYSGVLIRVPVCSETPISAHVQGFCPGLGWFKSKVHWALGVVLWFDSP